MVVRLSVSVLRITMRSGSAHPLTRLPTQLSPWLPAVNWLCWIGDGVLIEVTWRWQTEHAKLAALSRPRPPLSGYIYCPIRSGRESTSWVSSIKGCHLMGCRRRDFLYRSACFLEHYPDPSLPEARLTPTLLAFRKALIVMSMCLGIFGACQMALLIDPWLSLACLLCY